MKLLGSMAEAIHAEWCGDPDACPGPTPSDLHLARTYLASLAQHRDDLQRVIDDGMAGEEADAVLAYLSGE